MVTVFVSHSSGLDPYAESVRIGVCDRLREKGYKVLVDDLLRPGHEWRSMLYHWLAQCDGAVLLLNEAALVSRWVRREVDVLLWRRALGSSVHIVPALLGSVRPERVENSELSELTDLQFADTDSTSVDDANATTLVKQIVDQFSTITTESLTCDAMHEWIDHITFLLKQVKERARLLDAARALRVDDADLGQVVLAEGPRFLAHQLLGSGHDRAIHEVGGRTYQAIRVIARYMEEQWRKELIEEVVPTWVDVEAARSLLTVARKPTRAVVLLNARSQRTGIEYVARATCCALDGYWCQVAGTTVGEDAAKELLAHYESVLERLLNIEPPWTLKDAEGQRWNGMRFLVVDPKGAPLEGVADAISILQARFPQLVVIVLIGDTEHDKVARIGWTSDRVVMLEPSLRDDEERQARDMVANLRGLKLLRSDVA